MPKCPNCENGELVLVRSVQAGTTRYYHYSCTKCGRNWPASATASN
jgi:predicted RNA-binding Zn-ribbon protein involved in translation (DUF1610 family)